MISDITAIMIGLGIGCIVFLIVLVYPRYITFKAKENGK